MVEFHSTTIELVKACTACGRTLPKEYFCAQKRGKYGLKAQCRECDRERHRKWRAANLEKERERARKWRAANPEKWREIKRKYRAENLEKERERKRKYRAENPEKALEGVRKWRAANPEKARERHRKYRAANLEKERERARKWRAANPEKWREIKRKYRAVNPEAARVSGQNSRARRRAALGSHTAAEIREQLKRQKSRCYYCGCPIKDGYHIEHVVPLSRGGSNGISNIVLACATCNMRKHDKMPHEWAEGGRLL